MDVENDFNTLDGSLMSELHIPMHTTDSIVVVKKQNIN